MSSRSDKPQGSLSTHEQLAQEATNGTSPRRRFLQATMASAAFGLASNLGLNLASSPRAPSRKAPSLPTVHSRNSKQVTPALSPENSPRTNTISTS